MKHSKFSKYLYIIIIIKFSISVIELIIRKSDSCVKDETRAFRLVMDKSLPIMLLFFSLLLSKFAENELKQNFVNTAVMRRRRRRCGDSRGGGGVCPKLKLNWAFSLQYKVDGAERER